MGFCSCSVKFLMVLFNVICSLAGLVILIVGAVMKSNSNSYKHLMLQEVRSTSIALIVLGAIIFIIAFLGCCGAMREDSCMVQTYGIALLVILICEVAIGITAFVYRQKVESTIEKEGEEFFKKYNLYNHTINSIQSEFECCGYNGPKDYNRTVPLSCCKKQKQPCVSYQNGCKHVIIDNLKKNLKIIGGIAIGVGAVELIGVFCAFFVASSIKNQKGGYI